MSELLFRYERVNPTTWAYLSSLLTLALFFKFNRLWSVRNIDLLLMILLAPALLCIKIGLDQAGIPLAADMELLGYAWLFAVNGLLLLRMLLDPGMVRRPLLEANLSGGGLSFLGVSLMLFLAANVINGEPAQADLYAAQRAESLANREATELERSAIETHGPGFPLLYLLPHISTQRLIGGPDAVGEETDAASGSTDALPEANPAVTSEDRAEVSTVKQPAISAANVTTARVMAVLSQFFIVIGIVLIAGWHFDNWLTGIAAATCYLLLPYTAMWTGNVIHALPGALLVGAVLFYRRPLIAGTLIGVLAGTIYYPVFLLPLWIMFYWRRGLRRFVAGVLLALTALVVTLIFISTDLADFLALIQQMFALQLPKLDDLGGVWGRYWNAYYRLPVFALFIGLSFSFIVWPAQKNLGTLLSCSAALMIGTQFWHAHSGGMALAWYLPVLLLTIFRPNLEDRVAVEVVRTSRWSKPAAA